MPLVKDVYLLLYVSDILLLRGWRTVQVCKFKGHAARGMVRRADLEGNNYADWAADLGRRRQNDRVTTARRLCTQACHAWNPFVMHFHQYFIAVARIPVDHDPDSGTAPHPTVWSAGATAKKARFQEAVCEFAAAPGPDSLGWMGWARIAAPPLTTGDLDSWSYSSGLLVKFSSFLGTLHWRLGEGDLVMEGCIFC